VRLPQIRMESEMARIGINQTMAQIAIRQKNADLSIRQPKADVSIQTTKGKLTIDQMQAWEEMNLMSTIRFTEKHAKEAIQLAQEGTARRAEQGAELLDIHNNGNTFAEQARQNQLPKMKTLSLTYIPSPLAVKSHYERGNVQIEVQENKPIIDVQINSPEYTYYPGNVEISMDQYPQLHIDFEPRYV